MVIVSLQLVYVLIMNSLYCEVNTMLHNNLLVDILHYIVVIMYRCQWSNYI